MENFKSIEGGAMYSIFQFSIMTKIPTNTLMYYNNLDILKPVKTVSENRHFYDDESLLIAQQILIYRSCHITLDNIRSYLEETSAKNDLKTILTSQLVAINNKRSQSLIKETIKSIRSDYIDRIRIVGQKEKYILSLRDTCSISSMGNILRKLTEAAMELNVKVVGKHTIIWHGELDMEIYIPIEYHGVIKSDLVRKKKPGKYCMIEHNGSVATLSSAYRKLYSCIKVNGLKIVGPFEETYISVKKIQLAVPVKGDI